MNSFKIFAVIIMMAMACSEPDAQRTAVETGPCETEIRRNIREIGPEIVIVAENVPHGTFVLYVEHSVGRDGGHLQIPVGGAEKHSETVSFADHGDFYKFGVVMCGSGIIDERCDVRVYQGGQLVAEYTNHKIGSMIYYTVQ